MENIASLHVTLDDADDDYMFVCVCKRENKYAQGVDLAGLRKRRFDKRTKARLLEWRLVWCLRYSI